MPGANWKAHLIEQLRALRTCRFIGHDNPHRAMEIQSIQGVVKTVTSLSNCVISLLENPMSFNWREARGNDG